MYPIIYSFELAESTSYDVELSNGEYVVNRQLRLLRNAGIYKVGIAGDARLFDYCIEQKKNRIDIKKMEFEYLGNKLVMTDYKEELMLLQWNMIYTEDVILGLIQTEERIAVASYFRLPQNYKGMAVRIDMDHVVEIGDNICGLDCCPVFPLIKISMQQFQEEKKQLKEGIVCNTDKDFFISILETVSIIQKAILYVNEADSVWECCTEKKGSIYELPFFVVQNDESQRKVICENGCIVDIKKICDEENFGKKLVICDESINRTSIRELFEKLKFEADFFVIEGEANQESLSLLEKKIKQEQYELLIAIGSDQVLRLADDARGNKKIQYPSIALMLLPLQLSYTIDKRYEFLLLDGNIVSEANKDLTTDVVYGMLYDLTAQLLCNQQEGQERKILNTLLLLQGTANKGLNANREIILKVLEARKCWNECKKDNTNNSILALADRLAAETRTNINIIKTVSLPYIYEKLYSYLELKEDEKSYSIESVLQDKDADKEKVRKTLFWEVGKRLGLPFNSRFTESIQRYSQRLVDVGIFSSIEISEQDENKIEEKVRSEISLNDCNLLSINDLIDICRQTIDYDNKAMITSQEKKTLQKESMEETGIKPKLPLKKRIKKSLKKLKTVKSLLLLKKKLLFRAYQVRFPVNTKWILFESYGGTENFGCNTRAIYEAMLEDPDYFDFKFIWAFLKPGKFTWLKQNPNTVVVKRGSRRYIKFCARAKYIFTNTGMPKYIKPNKNQEMIYTWHGKPLKKIGCSFAGESEGKRTKKQLIKDYTGSGKRLTKLLSPAPIFTGIMADAYNLSSEKRKTAMVETGYPRNDFLFKYTPEDVLKIKFGLSIPLNKKVILYAPTWRPFKWIGGKSFEHTKVLDLEKLQKDLGDEYVFLCRLHHLERDSMHFEQYPGFVYDVSMVEDVNELYIISDMLISDYSGTVFDFANMQRPIILFMYDKDEYVNDANGLNFDLDFLPGPVVEDQKTLTKEIQYQIEHFVYDEKYRKFNEACNCLDGADCSSRTAHQIVEVNPEETQKQKNIVKLKIIGRNTKLTLRGYLQKLPFIKNDNTRRIASYKNKYKGQRCFLIGNGPSLRLADLNMLKDEICFGCNMIYKVFERSDWRPTFLCASDRVVAKAAAEELQNNPESTLWVSRTAYDLLEYKGDNLIYVSNLRKEKYYVHGNMTEYYVPSIATVMTFMIELAMFMGFSEIYLLGVDFSIGHGKNDHFMNSYRDKNMTTLEHKKMRSMFKGEDIGIHQAQVRIEGRALYAYQQLEKYARKHGYHVYNATRGGMLEVFDRADLDQVIKNN